MLIQRGLMDNRIHQVWGFAQRSSLPLGPRLGSQSWPWICWLWSIINMFKQANAHTPIEWTTPPNERNATVESSIDMDGSISPYTPVARWRPLSGRRWWSVWDVLLYKYLKENSQNPPSSCIVSARICFLQCFHKWRIEKIETDTRKRWEWCSSVPVHCTAHSSATDTLWRPKQSWAQISIRLCVQVQVQLLL